VTAHRDPGPRWTEEVVGPLRRQAVECDVAPRVMARILAERDAAILAASARGPQRYAWVASLSLAGASLVFLISTLVVMVTGGDEGVRQATGVLASGWQIVLVFGRLIADLGGRVLAEVLPVARKVLALIEVSAPLLKGAGTLAAAGGLCSILFSSYVFASARRTAPRADFNGGTR
jgi:hypothetical protein